MSIDTISRIHETCNTCCEDDPELASPLLLVHEPESNVSFLICDRCIVALGAALRERMAEAPANA